VCSTGFKPVRGVSRCDNATATQPKPVLPGAFCTLNTTESALRKKADEIRSEL